jgi:hypothetical protein
VIVNPVLDVECMAKVTAIARHELGNPLVAEFVANLYAYARAHGLTATQAVFAWLQQLPQTDDDGTEEVRAVACNPRQRLRPFADDPNCFERALTAIILLEVIDPRWQYTLASVDEPMSHTGVLRRSGPGAEWEILNLFPSKRGPRGLQAAMRQAQQAHTRNVSGQQIFATTIHPVGYALLDRFGGRDAANFVTGQEQHYGLLKRPPPRGPALHAPELRVPAPLVVPETLPPAPQLHAPELHAELLQELMPPPEGDMIDAEPTEAIAWTPLRKAGAPAPNQAPATPQRWRLW